MPIIQTKKLYKIYNEDTIPVYALKDLNLDFEVGEFTTIVGPSGSGKTTLLNMIGGLDVPTRGSVLVDGTDISTLKKNQVINFRLHHIGFVFQSYNLIPVLTALENVSLIMELQNREKKEIRERAIHVLEEVGLADKLNSRPSELSGGQQQRVAVARALASRPKYVLADEPTANLDSKSAMNLLDIMARLNKDESMTFIFSTHDQRVIERARRVVTLVDGALYEDLKKEG
ncbi:ABC transporter ATP-binding protein [Cyclobacteriaceae bacterium YHN15]|nr:ABC transporter ATP-binding protein [Cyclobacteriaceae bacterium YHN15]